MKVQKPWPLPYCNHNALKLSITHQFHAKIYTTNSPITGTLTINPQTDLPPNTLQISLTGKSSTQLAFLRPSPSVSTRTFLRLDMPIAPEDLSPTGAFQAWQKYEFPFAFVVPAQLGSAACVHGCNALVRDQHL